MDSPFELVESMDDNQIMDVLETINPYDYVDIKYCLLDSLIKAVNYIRWEALDKKVYGLREATIVALVVRRFEGLEPKEL